jgi:hypothetical protein
MSDMETLLIGLLIAFIALQVGLFFLLVRLIGQLRPRSGRRPPRPQLPRPDKQGDDAVPVYGSMLRVEMGDEPGSCYILKPKGITWIGRDGSANDIVIPCSSVSRRHCRVESDGMTFYIHDLGSTNGTFLNGQQVSTSVLRHGDTLVVGSTVFRFLMNPEKETPLQ